MANQRISSEDSPDSRSLLELELLEALLLADVPYPWNPAASESETYWRTSEEALRLEDWAAEELSARAQAFSAQIEACWGAIVAADGAAGASDAVRASLQQRFAAFVPAGLLDAIASQARSLLPANQSLADRIVSIAGQLLPHWAEEDLHVLARPLAHAMRGREPAATTSTFAIAASAPWAELSEIEQARLILAAACHALTQLEC